ncbi:hypothetical protein Lgra_0546 [Legionella gratiana]|uniref:Uncharacterized protein n=1 Tax=Legionella gratiana TaxID=45066 RepID=A0A378J2J0_9GAMM|nr:hypothetical protein [Legionella gratiana]KTD14515.1 hypothetical protein Lgra_0546 [Legionella gratiana]STX41963.1 Uncharacterised protein [Legionella gratiana]
MKISRVFVQENQAKAELIEFSWRGIDLIEHSRIPVENIPLIKSKSQFWIKT